MCVCVLIGDDADDGSVARGSCYTINLLVILELGI